MHASLRRFIMQHGNFSTDVIHFLVYKNNQFSLRFYVSRMLDFPHYLFYDFKQLMKIDLVWWHVKAVVKHV